MQYNDNYKSSGASPDNQYDYFDSMENDDQPEFDDEFSAEERERYERRMYPPSDDANDFSYPDSGPKHQRFRGHGQDSGSRPDPDAPLELKKSFSGRKLLIWTLSLLFLFNLLIIGYVILDHTYAFIGNGLGRTYAAKIDTTELILTDTKVTEFDGIERLDALSLLDIRGLDVSVEKYKDLRTMIPKDCQVLWDIPIGGQLFDSSAHFVSFSDASPAELDSLKLFDDLQSVNASGCTLYKELKQLAFDLPECDIKWTIPFGGKTYSSSLTELKLTDDVTPEQMENIHYFPWLVYVDGTEYTDYDTLLKLSSDLPNCEIVWKINLAGIPVNSSTTSINLSGRSIGNLDEFKRQLSYLPKLNYVDMCNCNLSNEQMANLKETFPDKKFVWIVSFGQPNVRIWKVRTDVTAFSTLNSAGGTPFDQNDFAPLFLYCTDLVALDLGHNSLTSISMISNLKKLKYLILGDNKISDITPIASLEELEYLEIWLNNISDVTPLLNLEHLLDIDIANNRITDLSQFYPMKKLQSIRLDNSLNLAGDPRNNVSRADLNKLAAAIPQCRIDRVHGDAQRYQKNNVRFLAMKLAFNNQAQLVYFNGWDDVKYSQSFYE